jgi:hypothetical protein
MDQWEEWVQVKQILSDIVQSKSNDIWSELPRIKNSPVILGSEHESPWNQWYILFDTVQGYSQALKIQIKILVEANLTYDKTIILCSSQRDLFKEESILDSQVYPLVFATNKDIEHIFALIWAIDVVQSKYYPDFTI